ncbi:S24 family peptidase [Coralloluteibacterium thermophilus]|uniref:S24 family peptidase n=1 Tax=Coralloluteibacterium thermophilum TaxID=2707049 RepID=A0ABV9NQV9_9GAMM
MKRIRLRAGYKSQKEAADAIGCERGTVSMWEAPSSQVKTVGDYLLEVARAYKVRPEWVNDLDSDDDGFPWQPTEGRRVKVAAYEIRAVDGEDGIDPDRDAMVPVYDILVSGGQGVIIPEFVETKYRLPYQIDWLNRWNAKPEDILIAKVHGSSMEPILWHGDKAIIHRGRRLVSDGRVYSLIYGGEARVKRLYRLADGSLRINSANPDKDQYPDEVIGPEEMDSVYVIGQVIDKMGSGGLGV